MDYDVEPVVLFTDSQNALLNVLNPLNTARTRHIDIRYKWLSERVKKGDFDIKHLSGNEMPADGLKKPLTAEKHLDFLRMMKVTKNKVT